MNAPFVFVAMGTVVSVRAGHPLTRAVEDSVLTAFAEHEDRFSLHLPASEGVRFARREVSLGSCSPAFRDAYEQAVIWRAATQGAFTPHRPDGVVDLAGIVKALAIADAGAALTAHGIVDWCVNAGGDVLTAGVQADGCPWRVGVVDPGDRSLLLSRVDTGPGRRAVATSGVAERGEHVWRIGAEATFSQVTVVAADIVTADVLATALLAAGPTLLDRAHDLDDIEVLACAADGRLWASAGFRSGSGARFLSST